jgi:hypothetical protein
MGAERAGGGAKIFSISENTHTTEQHRIRFAGA